MCKKYLFLLVLLIKALLVASDCNLNATTPLPLEILPPNNTKNTSNLGSPVDGKTSKTSDSVFDSAINLSETSESSVLDSAISFGIRDDNTKSKIPTTDGIDRISTLPAEIIMNIVRSLNFADINQLSQTSKHFRSILNIEYANNKYFDYPCIIQDYYLFLHYLDNQTLINFFAYPKKIKNLHLLYQKVEDINKIPEERKIEFSTLAKNIFLVPSIYVDTDTVFINNAKYIKTNTLELPENKAKSLETSFIRVDFKSINSEAFLAVLEKINPDYLTKLVLIDLNSDISNIVSQLKHLTYFEILMSAANNNIQENDTLLETIALNNINLYELILTNFSFSKLPWEHLGNIRKININNSEFKILNHEKHRTSLIASWLEEIDLSVIKFNDIDFKNLLKIIKSNQTLKEIKIDSSKRSKSKISNDVLFAIINNCIEKNSFQSLSFSLIFQESFWQEWNERHPFILESKKVKFENNIFEIKK